jgi:hypothetical protein
MNFPYVLWNIWIIILGCEILLRVISANMSSNYGPTHYNTTWWDSGSTPTVMGGATSHRLHPSRSCGQAMTETAEEGTSTEHLCLPLIEENFVCKWWQCCRKWWFDDYIEEISRKLVKIIYIFGLLYKMLFALCTFSLRSDIHVNRAYSKRFLSSASEVRIPEGTKSLLSLSYCPHRFWGPSMRLYEWGKMAEL